MQLAAPFLVLSEIQGQHAGTCGYLSPYRRHRPDNQDKGHVGGEQNGAADGELDKDGLRRSPVG